MDTVGCRISKGGKVASPKSSFTKEDLALMLALGKRVVEAKFGQLKETVVQNFREAVDPDIRLAGRVRARYDALREAGFTRDEAVEHTSRSVARTTETVLNSLRTTENQEEETCR